MNSVIQRLLNYYPGGYDKQPYDVPSLYLGGQGTFQLDDLTLYVTSINSVTIDLHAKTVSQVAELMPKGISPIVIQDGPAELLIYSTGGGNLPDTLNIATSPLWQILAPISRVFTGRRRSAQNAINQINMRASVKMWLDFWGESLGTPRLEGEPDQLYVTRLVGTTLEPNVNNVAIQQLFSKLGYDAAVEDSQTPLAFNVTIQMPLAKPNGYVMPSSYFVPIVNQVKASGTIPTVILEYNPQDSLAVSDSFSTIVITPESGQPWGSGVKWGQGHWYPPTQVSPPTQITKRQTDRETISDSITSILTAPPTKWGNRRWGQNSWS